MFKNDSKHKYNLSTYPFNERKSVKQQFSVNPFEVKPQKLTTQTWNKVVQRKWKSQKTKTTNKDNEQQQKHEENWQHNTENKQEWQ